MSLTVTIPGEPVAQGRPRAFRMGGGIRIVDPEKSRSWKGVAQVHMREALERSGFDVAAPLACALELRITAVYTCPKSAWKKRAPVPRRRKVSKPDADNIGKACLDAGNGLLYLDDSQVARLVVEKFIGAQGEAPHVVVEVRPMEPKDAAVPAPDCAACEDTGAVSGAVINEGSGERGWRRCRCKKGEEVNPL